MLPTPTMYRSRSSFLPDYFRRAIRVSQMDFESASWQMITLCLDPKRVYKQTTYHKQTKNQWARDDPAFTMLSLFFLVVAAIAYTVAFRAPFPGTFLRLVLGAVLFDFWLIGSILATVTWGIANKYLRVRALHSVDQEVEWMYAFDIHCNSFFPLFVMLHVLQFFLLPFLLSGGFLATLVPIVNALFRLYEGSIMIYGRRISGNAGGGFLATLVSNTLFLAALSYYHYITFLGYSALPFLENSVYFLYPVGLLIIGYVLLLIANVNCTVLALSLYFGNTTPLLPELSASSTVT